MTVEFKSLESPVEVKATADGVDYFEFEGYVGAFGNVDSHGDILVKGAAAEQVGQTIHFFKDHWTEFGAMDIVAEDDYGIKFTARAPKSDPEVVKLAERIKVGAPYKFSIGYRVKKSEPINGVRYLQKIELVEGSIVAYASNDNAILTGIKSRFGEQGFVLASAAQKAVNDDHAALVALAKALGV
jgi:HK97 family phage prohead protease